MKSLYLLLFLFLLSSCAFKNKPKTSLLGAGIYEFYDNYNQDISLGVDTLFPDGSGVYYSDDECYILDEKYTWRAYQDMFYLHYSVSNSIYPCKGTMEKHSPYSQHWKIYKVEGQNYYCYIEVEIIDGVVDYRSEDERNFFILKKISEL